MNNIVCGHCHAENAPDKHFCVKCGAFLHPNEFAQEVFELPELKMMRVVDNLITLPHQPINWDDLTDTWARKVERFKALHNIPELGKDTNADAGVKLDSFLEFCREPEFQIAFVGTIKTGKSTLINALLGKNYASMDVTPETAALTKFRASLRDYVKLTFYTKDEWKELMSSRTIRDAEAFMAEYRASTPTLVLMSLSVARRSIVKFPMRTSKRNWRSGRARSAPNITSSRRSKLASRRWAKTSHRRSCSSTRPGCPIPFSIAPISLDNISVERTPSLFV